MRARRSVKPCRRIAAALFAGLIAGPGLVATGAANAQTPLTRLAAPGPWPGISRIIAFDGGVWFVNSEPFADFNAADIYRYDPEAGTARYERGLFSQHAGIPAIHGGGLYWPYEDPRSNAALGEYSVTDGKEWRWQTMADAITLNVHAMAPCRGALIAGTGGWEGALQLSARGGGDWREVYRLPDNADGRSHITALGHLGQRCFFGVTDRNTEGPKLYEWTGEDTVPVSGWPDGERVGALTEFKGALYALNDAADGRTLWRYDGLRVEKIAFPANGLPGDLEAAGDHLLAVASDEGGGGLWRSADGVNWTRMQRFDGERPIDVAAAGSDVYVGTYRDGGTGALWGPAAAADPAPGPVGVALEPAPKSELDEAAVETTLRPLETVLGSESDYMTFRTALFGIALPVARTHAKIAGILLAKRARKPLPGGEMATHTGDVYDKAVLSRWLLLYAAGINGFGYVEPEWLRAPWTAAPRASEKYFDRLLISLWAAGRFRQDSAETVAALIERLGRADEPDWLKGDAVASLTVLTGQHFGHDLTAWRDWWLEARSDWPQE